MSSRVSDFDPQLLVADVAEVVPGPRERLELVLFMVYVLRANGYYAIEARCRGLRGVSSPSVFTGQSENHRPDIFARAPVKRAHGLILDAVTSEMVMREEMLPRWELFDSVRCMYAGLEVHFAVPDRDTGRLLRYRWEEHINAAMPPNSIWDFTKYRGRGN